MPTEKQYTSQFQTNFIKAVHYAMADKGFEYDKEAADWLGISAMTFHKLMERKQYPTVEQAVTLCKKGGINANWLFCNQGEMKMEVQNTYNDIAALINKVKP